MELSINNSILILCFKFILWSFTLDLTHNKKSICLKKIYPDANIRTMIQDRTIKKNTILYTKKSIYLFCERKKVCMWLCVGFFWAWEKAITEDESKTKQHLSVLPLREEKRE